MMSLISSQNDRKKEVQEKGGEKKWFDTSSVN